MVSSIDSKMELCFAFVLLAVIVAANFHAAESACADVQQTVYCVYWKNQGFCSKGHRYRSYMKGNCKRTCAFCQDCSSQPCANGGTCRVSGNSFICSCVLGFKGKTCSEVDACAKKPCKNGGVCTNSGSSFKCRCAGGYSGNTCEIAPKPTKQCKNSGKYSEARCKGWIKLCDENSRWYGFMKDHCSDTCGFCKEGKPPKCGQGPNKASTFRVVGGDEAVPHSWPWQAAINIKSPDSTTLCGGTLIAKKWVMTAGHCLKKKEGITAAHLEVILGDHNRSKIENTEQFRSVLRIVRHPNYNSETKDNDIALLELNREAVLNDNVGLACLPTAPPDPGNSNCYVTGFGRTHGLSFDTSVTLQEAQLPVVTNKQCKVVNNVVPITENMLCAGVFLDVNFRKSGCKGDSGGPFVCLKNNVWSVQGVVSWGSSTCLSFEKYTVFARVTRYLDWIKQTIS